MDWKIKYGGVLLVVGGLVIVGSQSVGLIEGMYAGTALFVVGGVLLYFAFEKWYCAACGQYLSRGRKPQRCDRCGSNRVTNQDPGAGRAVRIRD